MNKKILGILLVVLPVLQLLMLLIGFTLATFAVTMGSAYNPPATVNASSTVSVLQLTQTLVTFAFGFFGAITAILIIILVPLGIWLIIRGDKKWPEKFSISELLTLGWQKMADNFWFFAGIIFISFLLRNLPSIANKILGVNWDAPNWSSWTLWVSAVIIVIFFVIQAFIQIGMMQISLKVADGKVAKTLEMFGGWDLKLLGKYILSGVIYALIVLGGLILLVVPGVIWALKYQYFGYFVIEGAGPLEAIKKSGRLSKGAMLDILTLNVLSGLINLAGMMAMMVGLFATMPMIMVAQATSYRRLQEAQTKE